MSSPLVYTNKIAFIIHIQVENYTRSFTLEPTYTPGKHWVAVADITREQKTGGLSQDKDKLLR